MATQRWQITVEITLEEGKFSGCMCDRHRFGGKISIYRNNVV